jgi:large subunit ribosomal protein L25
MEEIKLDVQVRKQVGTRKIRGVRRENCIPAVVYGGKNAPTTIKVERNVYERIMRQYHGQNVLFHLNVLEGDKKLRDYTAIVKEEQHHPVNDHLVHIDFNRISLTEEINIKVQIAVKGEAVGVKADGGSLDHAMWELDIICLPTKIPANITVDVSHLKIGDAIHVHELTLPEGVRTKHDKDAIVVSVVPPMKDIVTDPLAAPTEVEVTKEKPKEAKAEGKTDAKAEAKPEKK